MVLAGQFRDHRRAVFRALAQSRRGNSAARNRKTVIFLSSFG
jgi:hypothetical protein